MPLEQISYSFVPWSYFLVRSSRFALHFSIANYTHFPIFGLDFYIRILIH